MTPWPCAQGARHRPLERGLQDGYNSTIPIEATRAKVELKPLEDVFADKVKLKAANNGSYTLGGEIAARVRVVDSGWVMVTRCYEGGS